MRKKHKKSKFGVQFITSSISTMLVLLLLGMVVFITFAAKNLSVYVKENFSFSVLLDDNMSESQIIRLQKQLNKEDFVKESIYISKAQALKEQTELMGTDPKEFLGYNPFTASIEVKLNAAYANADSLSLIENKIRQKSNIQDVLYQKDLINIVNDNIKKIGIALLVLATVLTLISFVLINNTIRLTIYSQRFLIHTMKLVGANWSFIRKPFINRSISSGLFAALIANLILVGAARWAVLYQPDLIDIITPDSLLIVVGSVFLFGFMITFLCSYFSINKYLRMKANSLYYI